MFVSMSNFPLSHLPRSSSFNIYMFPISLITFLHKLLSIPKSPPPCASQQLPAFIFWSQNFPLCLSAIFCMYLHVSSFSFNVMSQQTFSAHPVSISNFRFPLCASQFPASISLHTQTSLHWPLHHFLRFCCFNIQTSPAPTTSCMHLVSMSKFPPPCARSKKTCTGSKKEGAKVQKHPAQCERL